MKECANCQGCYDDILAECPVDQSALEEGVPGPTVLAGKFRIEARLGKGGMGSVYRAMHLGLKRYVALKTLLPQNISQTEFADRFRREAEASGRIKHPNVVDVMDFGFAEVGNDQVGYLAMEFLEGSNLRDFIKKKGKLSMALTVEIMTQVCEAVGAAHKLGIIHRDLKPDNIWLQGDEEQGFKVKVLDFGIAKLADRAESKASSAEVDEEAETQRITNPFTRPSTPTTQSGETGGARVTAAAGALNTDDGLVRTEHLPQLTNDDQERGTDLFKDSIEQLTQTGAMIGTLPYMSPEQCLSQPCSPVSDIYSLGIITYEMLTGQRPFRGKSFEVAIQHLREQPEPPSKHVKELPTEVDQAVLKALAKEPQNRQASAPQFAAELGAYLKEQRRKKANIKKMVVAGAIGAAILSITALIQEAEEFRKFWNYLLVRVGINKEVTAYQTYSSLKMFETASGKEAVIAVTTPPRVFESSETPQIELVKQEFLCCYSRDGKLVAFCRIHDKKPRLTILDGTGRILHKVELEQMPERVRDIQFATDNNSLLVATLNQIRVIDVAAGKQQLVIDTLEPNDLLMPLATLPDTVLVASIRRPTAEVGIGALKYSLKENSTLLSLWNYTDGLKQSDLTKRYGEVELMAAPATGTLALVQWLVSDKEPTRRIELWDLAAKIVKKEWLVQGQGGIAISNDGARLALSTEPGRLLEFDSATLEQIKDYPVPASEKVKTFSYTSDGQLMMITARALENISAGIKLYQFPPASRARAFSGDINHVIVESVVVEAKQKD